MQMKRRITRRRDWKLNIAVCGWGKGLVLFVGLGGWRFERVDMGKVKEYGSSSGGAYRCAQFSQFHAAVYLLAVVVLDPSAK